MGGFPEKLRLHEDRFLMLRLADNAVRWRLCLSAPAVQRCHAKSTTATVGERFFWENRIIFFELALETMPNREWGFLVPEITGSFTVAISVTATLPWQIAALPSAKVLVVMLLLGFPSPNASAANYLDFGELIPSSTGRWDYCAQHAGSCRSHELRIEGQALCLGGEPHVPQTVRLC